MDPGAMTSDWYYIKRGAPAQEQAGPFVWEQLYALAQSGAFAPDDLVWNAQLPVWLAAGQIPGLFALPLQHGAAPRPTGGRRSWLLPVLIPIIALIIVGGGLGSYFALWRGDGGTSDSVGGGATTTSSTAAEAEGPAAIAIKLPDRAKLVETAAWGEVPINQVCVVLAEGQSSENADNLARALGGSVVGAIEEVDAYQIETNGATEAELQAAINTARATAGVALAVPNQPVIPAAAGEIWGKRITPLEDSAYGGANGEGYELIGVQKAWDYIRGAGLTLNPVQVGVVDTGLYAGNGQFDGGANISYTDSGAQLSGAEPITYSDGSTGSDPAGGHGTGINTIIGSDEDDGGPVGIASVMGGNLTISNTNMYTTPYGYGAAPTSPDPSDPSKVVWTDGSSYSFSDLAAIMSQVNSGSQVINLSWGPKDFTKVDPQTAAIYKDFFQKLHAKNPKIVFVAAAGNEGKAMNGDNYFPAGFNIPNLITVGNTNNDGSMFADSNTKTANFEVTLSAPGEQSVRGYDPSTGQVTASGGGSSMAAPQVAAAVALLQSLNPELDAAQIKQILSVTARKNDAGDPILAVDEAVFEVINMTRELDGLPALTREQMQNQGVIDAVATPVKDSPNEYLVRAIVQSVGSSGVDVTITLSSGEIRQGETPRAMTAPGEVGWMVRMDDDKGIITVYRQDTKAGSRISLEQLDINGSWKGTITFAKIDIDQSAAPSGGGEGCSFELIGALIAKMQGRPFPMTMTITVDAKGNGQAITRVDMSSIVAELAAEYPDMNVSSTDEPSTLLFTYKGNTLTFQLDQSSATGSMTATVSKQGDTLVIDGTLEGGSAQFSMLATWSLTLQ
jgi:hypothetical protein